MYKNVRLIALDGAFKKLWLRFNIVFHTLKFVVHALKNTGRINWEKSVYGTLVLNRGKNLDLFGLFI